MNKTLKKILIFVVIIGVLIILAIIFLGKKGDPELQNTGVLQTTSQSADKSPSSNFLQSLSQVKSIELDTTIFENKIYQRLNDYTIPIILNDDRLIGRSNPFAPVGVDIIFNQPDSSGSQNVQNKKTDLNITNPAEGQLPPASNKNNKTQN